MSLGTLLVLGIFSLLVGGIIPPRLRGWLILAGSLVGIYWLQTASPIRQLDFWLPSTALLLTVLTWGITRSRSTPDSPARRSDILAAMVILAAVLLIALLRYADPLCCLTATTPPSLWKVATFLATGGVAAALLLHTPEARGRLASGMIVLLLVVFLVLKSPILARWSSAGLRLAGGQEPALAAALDLAWVGFSFLAFRLIHVLRDYQSGRLPAYGLSEFVSYALFYPAYLAGPIDRIQRFTADLRQATSPTANQGDTRLADLLDGGQRILVGLVKKFVVADSLALIALNAQNAAQVSSPGWAWLLLYAYGLRIYFDFAGYTDIALGLARWLHIKLPENFDRPYLKLNLTAFWNSWHMTLAGWFRAYVFNPLTRALRQSQAHFAPWLIILTGQLTTMLLIGLWHGVTWNFAIWGAWHGVGLFVHSRFSEWSRPRQSWLQERPRLEKLGRFTAWLITFNYINLGWVWFALPTPKLAWHVYQILFGAAS